MLFLRFLIRNEKYVIETSKVVEVIPLVQLKHVPRMPSCVAGLCNYRGSPIPVIDLCQLVEVTPSRRFYSTRIVLVNYQDLNGEKRIAGLLAERITETIDLDDSRFIGSGVQNQESPFLAEVMTTENGIVQRIEIDSVLQNILSVTLSEDQAAVLS